MISTTRKRKLSSLDTDSCPLKKTVVEELSLMRRSPRKLQQSPLNSGVSQRADSPGRSPCTSPLRLSLITSSFYGKQKPNYLTPLERKAVKESLPSPPPAPPSVSPTLTQKPAKKKKAKGGNKPRKVTAGLTKGGKISNKINPTAVRTLSKLNSGVAVKPFPSSSAAPASSKPSDPRKIITFSSMKPKPKVFVGAAFFCTGKKPSSMYKKSAPKSFARPASVAARIKAVTPKEEKEQVTQAVMPRDKDDKSSTKPRVKFDLSDWIDSVDERPKPLQPLCSPERWSEKYGITHYLKVVLTRSPSSGFAPLPSSSNIQDVINTSDHVCNLSKISPISTSSSPPRVPEGPAVYPIFGSALKRSKKAAPLSTSTPYGTVPILQHSPAVKERSVRRKKEKLDDDQLIIDAGQKQFGATMCCSCGMVYSADNPEDHFQHTQFHRHFLDSIRYVAWKKERVVAEFWDGKILLVLPNDPKYAVKKAEDVRRVADSELGFQQVTLSRPTQAKTYLFINTERMVVGCLVAEPIRQAYRVLEQPDQHKDLMKDDFMERHRAWCCSTVPEPALCGISRVWVFSLARRRGIATRMLDTVRNSFMYGSHLTKEEVAFSDPTPDGKQFASKYCNTPAFLVYNFVS